MTAVVDATAVDVEGGGGEELPPFIPPTEGAAVYEMLTDEECYLVAILTDPSGLDIAEFLWVDEEKEDGCWRAWEFQWAWWRCQDQKQIDQSGRSIGKSESIMARACSFIFRFAGQEMVITAPQSMHTDAITNRLEGKLKSTRLLLAMIRGGLNGFKHKPFHVTFLNNAQIMSRIPQLTGLGIKGTHPVILELDEAQDYPENGWTEIRTTLKRGSEGAQWRVHGVTKGLPDDYYDATQEGSGFTVHHYTGMHRPTWTDEEREEMIREFKSKNDPDYRRNILGIHGDATNAIFDLRRLMRIVDQEQESTYNAEEYWYEEIRAEQVEDRARRQNLGAEHHGEILAQLLDFPQSHKQYKTFWAGMDVGITRDPSALVVFAEYLPTAAEKRRDDAQGLGTPLEGATRLKLIMRLELLRISTTVQVEAILKVIDFYRPRAFAMDATGNGLGMLQQLQQLALRSRLMRVEMIDPEAGIALDEGSVERANDALTTIKGYNFGGKVVVDIDEEKAAALPANVSKEELVEKAGIKRLVKEYATDKVRDDFVDRQRLLLPWDRTLLKQMNGQTFVFSPSPVDAYGNRRRTYSEGQFHCLVANTMVWTSRGHLAIQDVKPGMMVATRAGWKPVLDAWQTASSAQVLTVEFSNGASLTGTSEHRVWTKRGWVEIQNLLYGDEVVTCTPSESSRTEGSCLSASCSMARPSTGIPNRGGGQTLRTSAVRRASVGFTRRSGRPTTDRSLPATTSITRMGTTSTTLLRTSSASARRTTTLGMGRSTTTPTCGRRSIFNTSLTCARWQLSGIAHPKEGRGTVSTGSVSLRMQWRSQGRVSTAERSSTPRNRSASVRQIVPASRLLMLWTRRSRCAEGAPVAAPNSRASEARSERTATTVVRHRTENQRMAVYDLTVADQPEFFANGILVHNSFDGVRMAILGKVLEPIEEFLKTPPAVQQPVYDLFGGEGEY